MLNPSDPMIELLRRDDRYNINAYLFVDEALRVAQEMYAGEEPATEDDDDSEFNPFGELSLDDAEEQEENHVTGQELCEAIRKYALDQYGLLAKSVLNHWGIKSTRDFGEIVFNLIKAGRMRKSDTDRLEDFDEVFDFESGLQQSFRMSMSDSSKES